MTVVQPSSVRTEWSGRDGGSSQREQLDAGEALEPKDVAESVVFAASQSSTATVSEIDVLSRHKTGEHF